jgi:hypothetical protein
MQPSEPDFLAVYVYCNGYTINGPEEILIFPLFVFGSALDRATAVGLGVTGAAPPLPEAEDAPLKNPSGGLVQPGIGHNFPILYQTSISNRFV